MRTNLFKATALTAGAAALAMACVAPGLAAAQSAAPAAPSAAPAPPADQSSTSCAQEQDNRAVAGGATGALAGAVIGHNVTGGYRYNRSGNTLIGGLLGAVVGAAIGSSSADCQTADAGPPPPPAPPRRVYRYQPAYRYAPPYYAPGPVVVYAPPYAPVYEGAPPPPPPPENSAPQGAPQAQCTYVEDAVRMPDGSMSKRMIHVCQDSSGQYQIVQ